VIGISYYILLKIILIDELINFLFTYLFSITFLYYFIPFSLIQLVHIHIYAILCEQQLTCVDPIYTIIIHKKFRKKRWNNKEILLKINKYSERGWYFRARSAFANNNFKKSLVLSHIHVACALWHCVRKRKI
jgi:hypothetical protein